MASTTLTGQEATNRALGLIAKARAVVDTIQNVDTGTLDKHTLANGCWAVDDWLAELREIVISHRLADGASLEGRQ